ncbi:MULTISPECIES: hypothetical protein [unclassified Streptomyces]|uniref:hypothetical protein n=1 Tax=unclassified Streptomyces TaxID=2593676 RepID=UPI0036651E68
MTAHAAQQKVLKVARTGWSKARHCRGKGVRTCVPAVDSSGPQVTAYAGAEWNVVRGED